MSLVPLQSSLFSVDQTSKQKRKDDPDFQRGERAVKHFKSTATPALTELSVFIKETTHYNQIKTWWKRGADGIKVAQYVNEEPSLDSWVKEMFREN